MTRAGLVLCGARSAWYLKEMLIPRMYDLHESIVYHESEPSQMNRVCIKCFQLIIIQRH